MKNPGPGYRLLERGEIIVKGDEYLWHGNWMERTLAVGDSFDPGHHMVTRRLCIFEEKPRCLNADPGEGYRLLQPGERIEAGDEWLNASGVWGPVGLAGNMNPDWNPRRRKIMKDNTDFVNIGDRCVVRRDDISSISVSGQSILIYRCHDTTIELSFSSQSKAVEIFNTIKL